MRLELIKSGYDSNYHCSLTRMLDSFRNQNVLSKRSRVYILDTRNIWNNILAIRVPGKTIGSIHIDDSSQIVKIVFNKDIVGEERMFSENIYKESSKYIGSCLDVE